MPVNCFECLIHSFLFRNISTVSRPGYIGQESGSGRDTPELPSFYKHLDLSALIELPVMTSLSLQFLKPKLFRFFKSKYLQLDLIFFYPNSTVCA